MKKTSHRLYTYIARQKKLILLGILATPFNGTGGAFHRVPAQIPHQPH